MKCHVMQHFYLLRQKQFSEGKIQFYFEIISCDLSIYTMDHPKFIVSSQKEECIRPEFFRVPTIREKSVKKVQGQGKVREFELSQGNLKFWKKARKSQGIL